MFVLESVVVGNTKYRLFCTFSAAFELDCLIFSSNGENKGDFEGGEQARSFFIEDADSLFFLTVFRESIFMVIKPSS